MIQDLGFMNTDDDVFFPKSYILNLTLFLARRIGAALGTRFVGNNWAFALGACRHIRFFHG